MKLNRVERRLMNNPVRAFFLSRVVAWMHRGGELPPGARVLEIGCGRGAGVESLLKTFQPRLVAAMDLDPRQVRAARKYLETRSEAGYALLVGGVRHPPLADGAFDAVFSFGVLHHVKDWRGALDRVRGFLRPGGLLFLEEYYPATYANFITRRLLVHPREDRFKGSDLKEALESRGFSIIRQRELRGYSLRAVCRLP